MGMGRRTQPSAGREDTEPQPSAAPGAVLTAPRSLFHSVLELSQWAGGGAAPFCRRGSQGLPGERLAR